MTKAQKDPLFQLIKLLTKSEKRQFKLYAGRLFVNNDAKFIKLFNLLDKSKTYNEKDILKSDFVKKPQLANLKAHLYKQILLSLKLNPTHKNTRLQIREELDFASILYSKGLYHQSLKILEKSKKTALQNNENNLANEIVELEKIIESQYITRSMSGKADELIQQAKSLSEQNLIASKLSNLSLQLYSLFLKTGYVKNKNDAKRIQAFFKNEIPVYHIEKLGFTEKLWLYKCHLWYSFLMQDFKNSYKFALKWVNLFSQYPQMTALNPVFFLKGNNYLLEALFFIGNDKKFESVFNELLDTINSKNFPQTKNTEILSFLYVNFHQINLHFMRASFKDGIQMISAIEHQLNTYKSFIDPHHTSIFYYKFASLYFGANDNKACIFYLKKIISNKALTMKEDLMCYSRVLNLIAHYEEGLDGNLDLIIKDTYRFLIKMNDLHQVQKELIGFIKTLQDIYPQELKMAFKNLLKRLKPLEHHPFERRSFLYLDIISWLESKIKNKPVATIIKEKRSAKLTERYKTK